MDYLFVYGTLMRDLNNGMSRFLQNNSEFVGNGYFYGKLFDLGWYPGAVESGEPNEYVHGNIFKLKDSVTVFKVLDDYEGIGDGDPGLYEYKRELVMAYLEDGTAIKTWFYAYNHPTEKLIQIPSGNYLDKGH